MSIRINGFTRETRSTLLLIVISIIALTGCSNSTTVIGPLYNRLDNQMSSGILKLTTFEPPQHDAMMQLVHHFHYWHRRDQLPEYATLLNDIETTLLSGQPITKTATKRWASSVEAFTRQFRECHPINFSDQIIKTLSDEQVNSIEDSIRTRRKDHRERYGQSSREERIERRMNNMIKWAGRVGFDFNLGQKVLLRETFEKQISLRNQYFVLSDRWADDFFKLLRNRHSPELKHNMAIHLDKLWHLLESAHPKEWQQNRDLWSSFLYDLGQTMTTGQRTSTGKWLGKMGDTLDTLSRSSVSFEASQSSAGCSTGDA